jgi:hypothetical protein
MIHEEDYITIDAHEAIMESIGNMKKGIVSEPIDLDELDDIIRDENVD